GDLFFIGPGRQVMSEIGTVQTRVLRVELETVELDLDQTHTQTHTVQRKGRHRGPPQESGIREGRNYKEGGGSASTRLSRYSPRVRSPRRASINSSVRLARVRLSLTLLMPCGIRPDPAPGTQRQARLLRLEFVMTPAARRTRSPQQLLARKRRQVLQRAATKRAREFPVEPQIPPLTEPCARTDERMVAACHEQTRRRLDFKGGEIGIPIRPLDPSLLHQHRKIAENNLIKEYAIKFALAESG